MKGSPCMLRSPSRNVRSAESIFLEILLMFLLVELDKEKFEDLHRSIQACDDVLNSVEINLASFQKWPSTSFGGDRDTASTLLSFECQVGEQKACRKWVGPIVEEISVSPAVVRKIVEGAIDEAWVRALAEVEKRTKALDAKSKELRNIRGINDLKPMLENLVNKSEPRYYGQVEC